MISLQNVSKRFGRRTAVDSLSLEIPRGELFGMLGHNGAGKSTTIGMLLGQVFPDAGCVSVRGVDVFADRHRALERVGAIFEAPVFYDYLSGWTNLRIFTEYTGPSDPKRIKEVVDMVGLGDRIHDRVGAYSHGMRQRLALAQALLPEPELLILDEPTEGLDPEGIHEIRNLILKLNREWELTIFISSHLLSEMQQLCPRLAVMREGRLLFAGEWRQLDLDQKRIQLRVDRQAEAETGLIRHGLMKDFDWDGRGRLAPNQTVAAVAEWLVRNGFQIEAIGHVERTLEDFYLETIRNEGR
jgi:ABC-2 type transport system ATP-binding protein